MPTSICRGMLDALFPEGKIWEVAPDEDLDKLYDGIAENLEIFRDFSESLADLNDPYNTPVLSDKELEYGLEYNSSMTNDQRRDRLANAMTDRQNLGTPEDLQDKLQKAGFDVYVYQNYPTVNPTEILFGISGKILGHTSASLGSDSCYFGATDGYLIINGLNSDNDNEIPEDSGYWPLIFFIGGNVVTRDYLGEITYINRALIPSHRKRELVRLIVKYKPLHTWCGLLINIDLS